MLNAVRTARLEALLGTYDLDVRALSLTCFGSKGGTYLTTAVPDLGLSLVFPLSV